MPITDLFAAFHVAFFSPAAARGALTEEGGVAVRASWEGRPGGRRGWERQGGQRWQGWAWCAPGPAAASVRGQAGGQGGP